MNGDTPRITQAVKRLQEAERAVRARRGDLAAWDVVSAAERELAAARGEEYAVPLDVGFVPEAAVSAAALIQTESGAVLTFSAVRARDATGPREDAGVGVIEFELCSLTKFGYPNDEALAGHPLFGKGLDAYGVFEVRGSRWVKSMTEQNRVAFPNTPDSNRRHFVFTFHDSTFECIAKGLRASLSTKPYREVLTEIGARVLGV